MSTSSRLKSVLGILPELGGGLFVCLFFSKNFFGYPGSSVVPHKFLDFFLLFLLGECNGKFC